MFTVIIFTRFSVKSGRFNRQKCVVSVVYAIAFKNISLWYLICILNFIPVRLNYWFVTPKSPCHSALHLTSKVHALLTFYFIPCVICQWMPSALLSKCILNLTTSATSVKFRLSPPSIWLLYQLNFPSQHPLLKSILQILLTPHFKSPKWQNATFRTFQNSAIWGSQENMAVQSPKAETLFNCLLTVRVALEINYLFSAEITFFHASFPTNGSTTELLKLTPFCKYMNLQP